MHRLLLFLVSTSLIHGLLADGCSDCCARGECGDSVCCGYTQSVPYCCPMDFVCVARGPMWRCADDLHYSGGWYWWFFWLFSLAPLLLIAMWCVRRAELGVVLSDFRPPAKHLLLQHRAAFVAGICRPSPYCAAIRWAERRWGRSGTYSCTRSHRLRPAAVCKGALVHSRGRQLDGCDFSCVSS